jgi:hypothetical protein
MATRDLPRNFHSHEYGGVTAPPWWLLAPAYSVLPFIRRPLGMVTVHPRKVIARTVLLVLLPPLIHWFYIAFTSRLLSDHMGHIWLVYFAVASLAVSLAIFIYRWYGQRHGEELHSAEAGYSWLALKTRLPVALSEQLIIPLAIGLLGYGIAQTFSFELGWWLVASGASLCIMALWEYRRIWSQHQATVDDIVRAKTYEERMGRHETQQGPSQRPSDAPVFADLGEDEEPSHRGRTP